MHTDPHTMSHSQLIAEVIRLRASLKEALANTRCALRVNEELWKDVARLRHEMVVSDPDAHLGDEQLTQTIQDWFREQ